MLSAFGAGLGLGVAAVVWVTRDLDGVPDRLYRDPTERVAGLVLGKRPMGETKRVEPVRTSTRGVKASDFAKPGPSTDGGMAGGE